MTDYIEWMLEVLEDEEERDTAPWDGGWGSGAPMATGPAGNAVTGRAAAWGHAAQPEDGGEVFVTGRGRDGFPDREGEALRGTGAWGHAALRGDGGEPSVAGLARDWSPDGGAGALRGTGAWGHAVLPGDGGDPSAAGLARDSSPDGGAKTWGANVGAARFYAALRRTAEAASDVERRGAAGRIDVETERGGLSAADPAELDLAYQRDARRYDGAFTRY